MREIVESGRLAVLTAAVLAVAGAAVLLMVILHGCNQSERATGIPPAELASGPR